MTESLLSRAKKAGYQVLVGEHWKPWSFRGFEELSFRDSRARTVVDPFSLSPLSVTLDTWSLGYRPNDLDTAYNPFLKGEGVKNLFSDPVFVRKYCNGKSPLSSDATQEEIFEASIAAIGLLTPGNSRKWDDLKLLRKLWGESSSTDKSQNPIVLKGIQSVQDAELALAHGMDGVWVSNHGGRQVDGAIGSLHTLEKIAKLCRSHSGGEKTVIFDSGVRTGADVMKALGELI